MVTVKHLPNVVQITLTPNRSLSWQDSWRIVLMFGVFSLSIAVAWSLLGAWLILPFVGVEIGLLLFVTYLVSKATYQQETLLINSEYVSLQSCVGKKCMKSLFKSESMQFFTYEVRHPEDTFCFYLSDGSQRIRFAEFLNLADQKYLISLLANYRIALGTVKDPVHLDC